MQTTHEITEHQSPHDPASHASEIEIHVNERPVRMIGHRHTGLQIKEAAIAQHVKIQIDFLLYLERGHAPNKQIADDEEVAITHESRFHAIADDDNS
jgi:thioredoxin reductase